MNKLLSYRLDASGDVHLPIGCKLLSVDYLGNDELTACVVGDDAGGFEKRTFAAVQVGEKVDDDLQFVNIAKFRGGAFGGGDLVAAIFEIPPRDPHWEYKQPLVMA